MVEGWFQVVSVALITLTFFDYPRLPALFPFLVTLSVFILGRLQYGVGVPFTGLQYKFLLPSSFRFIVAVKFRLCSLYLPRPAIRVASCLQIFSFSPKPPLPYAKSRQLRGFFSTAWNFHPDLIVRFGPGLTEWV